MESSSFDQKRVVAIRPIVGTLNTVGTANLIRMISSTLQSWLDPYSHRPAEWDPHARCAMCLDLSRTALEVTAQVAPKISLAIDLGPRETRIGHVAQTISRLAG